MSLIQPLLTTTLVHHTFWYKLPFFFAWIIAKSLPTCSLVSNLAPLQPISNAADRKILLKCNSVHVTLLFKTLQWLPFSFRIKTEVFTLADTVIHDLYPPHPHFLSDLISCNFPTKTQLACFLFCKLPHMLLPQGLCTCFPISQNSLYPDSPNLTHLPTSNLCSNVTF